MKVIRGSVNVFGERFAGGNMTTLGSGAGGLETDHD